MREIILFLFLSLIFLGCSNNLSKEETAVDKNPKEIKSGASVQLNQSKVLAKVQDIFTTEGNEFLIKAKVLRVEEYPAYANIAVEGNVYVFSPAFNIDENKKIATASERNEGLLSLSKLNRDDEFRAVIFYEAQKGWFIREIIH